MKLYGLGSLHDVLDDMVVYRGLTPLDQRLPRFEEVARDLGLDSRTAPRKNEAAYGAVVARLVREARAITDPVTCIESVIYLGDTRMNDGMAFQSICRAGQWPGIAFIGSETDAHAQVALERVESCLIASANRWAALRSFDATAQDVGIGVDEHTAVLIDLDKTALGARGRNDSSIDQARVAAAQSIVASLLGPAFDIRDFQRTFHRLNQPDCHGFTSDNQDLVVYVCLILGTGIVALEDLMARIREGRPLQFDAFLLEVDTLLSRLPSEVQALHRRFRELRNQGDATPFKAFRREEYRETVARMDLLLEESAVEQRLKHEITLTAEVREVATQWKARGALVFGLSDKPEEACLPSDAQAESGLLPLHRTVTHIVGEAA